MTYSVQFCVRVVPGEFEFSYQVLDGSPPEAASRFAKLYPSQAEIQDDLRHAHLPVSLSIVGQHPPLEVTEEQLRTLRAEADQDYR